jgi:K+-transporting ATPase A subunit
VGTAPLGFAEAAAGVGEGEAGAFVAAATAVGALGTNGGLLCFCQASHNRSPENEKMISAMMRWVSMESGFSSEG